MDCRNFQYFLNSRALASNMDIFDSYEGRPFVVKTYFEPGDKVIVIDPNTMKPIYEGSVVKPKRNRFGRINYQVEGSGKKIHEIDFESLDVNVETATNPEQTQRYDEFKRDKAQFCLHRETIRKINSATGHIDEIARASFDVAKAVLAELEVMVDKYKID